MGIDEFEEGDRVIIAEEKHSYFGKIGAITDIDYRSEEISVQISNGPLLILKERQIEPWEPEEEDDTKSQI